MRYGSETPSVLRLIAASLLLWICCGASVRGADANDKFNAAGIVIAFPQRDLHLDTKEPLRVTIGDSGRASSNRAQVESQSETPAPRKPDQAAHSRQ